MARNEEILFWRLEVVADDPDSKVRIEEVMEKFGLTRREAADAMDRFSEEKRVEKIPPVSERGGNSQFRIFSLAGAAWKSAEELVRESKMVVFTGK